MIASDNAADHLGLDSLLAHRAAVLHYREKKNNLTIAREMGISRFRVARLLEQAVASGAVRVSVVPAALADEELAERLRRRFGLVHAVILAPGSSENAVAVRQGVAELAARSVRDLVPAGGLFGASWGSMLDAVSTAASSHLGGYPRADVVQLLGGLPTLRGALHATEVVARFASLFGGRAHVLHAPLLVPDVGTAEGLRAEPSVALTLSLARRVDVALLGVGCWEPVESGLARVLPASDVAQIQAASTVADVCGLLLDRAGRSVAEAVTERMIGATREDLEHISVRLAVASGSAKVPALRVVLACELANALVTDAVTAQALLESSA